MRPPIAYTYEADIHCPDCAEKAFGRCTDGLIERCNVADDEAIEPFAIYDFMEHDKVISCGTCRELFHDERTPYEYLKWEFKTFSDHRHDPYYAAMGYLFDIADVLHWQRNDPTPTTEWRYRPSMSNPLETMENETVASTPTADLIQFGSVLNRYLDFVKRAGKDY